MHAATVEAGAYPSPLNYWNFPKSVCTSVNEVICHGIPDQRPLEVGPPISWHTLLTHQWDHAHHSCTQLVCCTQGNDVEVKCSFLAMKSVQQCKHMYCEFVTTEHALGHGFRRVIS